MASTGTGKATAHQLTPEQIALSLARKKKKEEAAAAAASVPKEAPTAVAKLLVNPAAKVLQRDWLYDAIGKSEDAILVATWNVSIRLLF
jgi:hypothetical protein